MKTEKEIITKLIKGVEELNGEFQSGWDKVIADGKHLLAEKKYDAKQKAFADELEMLTIEIKKSSEEFDRILKEIEDNTKHLR